MKRFLALALSASLATGCSALGLGSRPPPAEEVPAIVSSAEEKLSAGDTAAALDMLREAREARGVDPELRARIDLLIERGAEQRYRELSQPGNNPARLLDQLELHLPRQLAVTSGVTAAEMYLEKSRRMKAYRAIVKVDDRFPPAGTHHERARAGRVLAEAGLSLADDRWSFLGFFRTSDKGKEVLQYLVDVYPSAPRCDEAYFKLGELYERDRSWTFAREHFEDLLRWHPQSPLAAVAEARVPHMRLLAIRSPEYDRQELLRAKEELERWLRHYPDAGESELAQSVRLDYADCLHRLVENDLLVARFYERIGKTQGARLHSARALEFAAWSQDERLSARAQALLDRLPAGDDDPTSPPPLMGPELPPTGAGLTP